LISLAFFFLAPVLLHVFDVFLSHTCRNAQSHGAALCILFHVQLTRIRCVYYTAWCTFKRLFFVKNYLQGVNTHTSVPNSTKIVPGQPIYLQNTRCARGNGATSSGDGRYSSEKSLNV
jgi:hypothetical protein